MQLHEDKEIFVDFISHIANASGYRQDVLEKDYYIVAFLKELASLQEDGLHAYFKGGTALYKYLGDAKRFSEDIDISVDTRNLTNSQNKVMLSKSAKKFKTLPRLSERSHGNKYATEEIYQYQPALPFDAQDSLERFGTVKVEATSFTISEPTETISVNTLLYACATEKEREVLRSEYNMASFPIKIISLQRIFIDKLFAAEAYTRKLENPHRALEAAKHIYDLNVMMDMPKIQQLLENDGALAYLLKIRLMEEKNRLDGIPNVLPSQFELDKGVFRDKRLNQAFITMQNIYVLKEQDRLNYIPACEKVEKLFQMLRRMKAWNSARIPEDSQTMTHT